MLLQSRKEFLNKVSSVDSTRPTRRKKGEEEIKGEKKVKEWKAPASTERINNHHHNTKTQGRIIES